MGHLADSVESAPLNGRSTPLPYTLIVIPSDTLILLIYIREQLVSFWNNNCCGYFTYVELLIILYELNSRNGRVDALSTTSKRIVIKVHLI